MLDAFLALLATLKSVLRTRAELAMENLALQQQLAILRRHRPRPALAWTDRLFWVVLSRAWSRWRDVLLVVKPDTVVGWHRSAFRKFWGWRSRKPTRRAPTSRGGGARAF